MTENYYENLGNTKVCFIFTGLEGILNVHFVAQLFYDLMVITLRFSCVNIRGLQSSNMGIHHDSGHLGCYFYRVAIFIGPLPLSSVRSAVRIIAHSHCTMVELSWAQCELRYLTCRFRN